MKNLTIDYWNHHVDRYGFMKKIFDKEPVDNIIIFACNEWDTLSIFGNVYVWDYFHYYVQKEKIKIELITASPIPYQSENLNITYWGEYWLIKTYANVMRPDASKAIKLKKEKAMGLKYHFICMNHRPHIHRCRLIDLLEKNNLISSNAISWHNTNEFGTYPFEYFKPKMLKFNQTFDSYAEDKNTSNLPIEYFQSFAQLISESTDEHMFFSEKVSMALIWEKPFLAHSGPGLHKYLTTLGFELYTEIFDYSFDSELDSKKRLNMIVNNFIKLCEIPLDKLKKIENQLQPKLEHNKNRAKEIAMNIDKFPEIIKSFKDDFSALTDIYENINYINYIQNLTK